MNHADFCKTFLGPSKWPTIRIRVTSGKKNPKPVSIIGESCKRKIITFIFTLLCSKQAHFDFTGIVRNYILNKLNLIQENTVSSYFKVCYALESRAHLLGVTTMKTEGYWIVCCYWLYKQDIHCWAPATLLSCELFTGGAFSAPCGVWPWSLWFDPDSFPNSPIENSLV